MELSKEQRVLRMMRKVLADIVKDTTPSSRGLRHPLSDDTIQSIRECFGLIAAREKELAEGGGMDTSHRPRYKDDASNKPTQSTVVPLRRIKPKNMN